MSLLLLLQATGLILTIYLFCVVFYRLYRHPLRGFPGPWLAAATGYYQTYYEVWRDGEFVPHVRDLHRIYGPIVRVNPNELHFSDPTTYTTIYSSNTHITKDPFFYRAFGESKSSFTSTDPREAKFRREIVSPLFSRRAILNHEGDVQDKIDTFITLLSAVGAGKPGNLYLAFHCLTLDILSSMCFSSSFDTLHSPEFSHPILLSMEARSPFVSVLKHFPILHRLSRLPKWMIDKSVEGLFMLRDRLNREVDFVLRDSESSGEPSERRGDGDESFYGLLLSPRSDKGVPILTRKDIVDEAISLCFAGTDTTGNALTVGTFHILKNPSIRKKLLQELVGVWPDKDVRVRYEALEGLQYLTAVIKESLRLSIGVPESLPRVVKQDMVINGVHIPAGTKIGMSAYIIHMNPEIFPDPETFDPERWVRDRSGKNLDSFLVAFSRGRRSCLGINLAWSELYLTFANLFRKLDMEIHKTTSEDMMIRYHNLPVYRGYPLHVVVKEREE